jgi:hypothetical protein
MAPGAGAIPCDQKLAVFRADHPFRYLIRENSTERAAVSSWGRHSCLPMFALAYSAACCRRRSHSNLCAQYQTTRHQTPARTSPRHTCQSAGKPPSFWA